jgi:hypothetical protein
MNRQGSEQRPRNSDSASPNPAVEAPGGRPFPGAALLAALALQNNLMVRVERLDVTYWSRRFVGARRLSSD